MMSRGGRRFFVLIQSVFISALLAFAFGSCGGDDRETGAVTYTFETVNEPGFCNPNNRYVWSMATFGDALYVGTYNLTSPLYIVMIVLHLMEPTPDWSEGTEVWRMDREGDWTRVVSGGFGGDPGNMGTRSLFAYDGRLYASTAKVGYGGGGGELWRTSDGENWDRVVEAGFGDPDTLSLRGMAAFAGRLYLGAQNHVSGGKLWRSADGLSWETITDDGFGNPNNNLITNLSVIDGVLWATTTNQTDGAEIWRSADGLLFEPAAVGGICNPNNGAINFIIAFRGDLYAGTSNYVQGCEIYRSRGRGTWEKVFSGGGGHWSQWLAWRATVYDGMLLVGTFDSGLPAKIMREGGRVYGTRDGETWAVIGEDGLGDERSYGVRTFAEFDGDLYIGMTGQLVGCRVVRMVEVPAR
ncbi:hypothetical protein ACFL4G_02750 [Thermodesulfobacteriota bacterium]